MYEILILALAVSAISLTVAKSKVFATPRAWLLGKWAWAGELVRCPYCLSHWVAFFMALCTMPLQPYADWLNLLVTTFALVGLSALLMGAAIKLLHMDQRELEELREENDALLTRMLMGPDPRDGQ